MFLKLLYLSFPVIAIHFLKIFILMLLEEFLDLLFQFYALFP